ncbi:CDP-glucose 4,6-dehydratase [Sphingobium yanoikuyae]|uniref:CDP-glucose 4,6-dehydratase n=1 Tax=Sphingobium yanoikuyae TaxID=13690 RepID=A0AA42WUN7_SPHYA|nr:CDP-glucose 4,6-dehydratase [Sphingobium yanoikuyae]MDH2132125.1 CDP-glucose 4,6-dehydratase [Sphingobium yanoikuyae]MDH2150252.1 CDP-glucose 4,6-dehydratase [Sphingobium yanoikuyae]MDH2167403.1 CDP-glucose 4,6-dehydratase [Sphingobium yanoikuyae]
MPDPAGISDRIATAFAGRRVLVTGHSGFKGGWLCLWLAHVGAIVRGISLPPTGSRSFYAAAGIAERIDSRFADIRDEAALRAAARDFDAEVIFHLAAQPLVRRSYAAPADTFATNVIGTAHVLDQARTMPSLKAVIVVTSDKCYENHDWSWPYRENDRLGGTDPYSASKACTELVAQCYRRSWFSDPDGPMLATVRAGNVIGGGDWAEDRLIPDIIRAAAAQNPMIIRNPLSIRPWQHVLEPLSGYLLVAEQMLARTSAAAEAAWNFGPSDNDAVTVEQLARALIASAPELDLPIRFSADSNAPHEARTLRLDSSMAANVLGWRACLSMASTIRLTADWYTHYLRGEADMAAFSCAQLAAYLDLRTAAHSEELLQCT